MRDDGHLNLDGPFVSHYATVKPRKTLCGKDIGVYSDGWTWGTKDKVITCDDCRKVNYESKS